MRITGYGRLEILLAVENTGEKQKQQWDIMIHPASFLKKHPYNTNSYEYKEGKSFFALPIAKVEEHQQKRPPNVPLPSYSPQLPISRQRHFPIHLTSTQLPSFHPAPLLSLPAPSLLTSASSILPSITSIRPRSVYTQLNPREHIIALNLQAQSSRIRTTQLPSYHIRLPYLVEHL